VNVGPIGSATSHWATIGHGHMRSRAEPSNTVVPSTDEKPALGPCVHGYISVRKRLLADASIGRCAFVELTMGDLY
jgi:hypothetical protein